jgi:hypothetical protein
MIFAFLYLVFCILVAFLGASRPLRFWGHFICSLLFTPFIGVLLLVAAGDNRATPPQHHRNDV